MFHFGDISISKQRRAAQQSVSVSAEIKILVSESDLELTKIGPGILEFIVGSKLWTILIRKFSLS